MKCIQCGSLTHNPKFCNRSCAAIYNNKKYPKRKSDKQKEPFCLWCGGIIGKNAFKYCSLQCKADYVYHIWINKWKLNIKIKSSKTKCPAQIRRYLLEKNKNSCSECGWDIANKYNGIVYLEVEHIDGDFTNNKEKNLKLLCPNCHSLTSTYKALNAGKGKRRLRIKMVEGRMV